MRILIVDDEEVLRDVLEVVLRREGFDIVPAASGAMKRGAFDYITKPFKNDEVLVVRAQRAGARRLVAENRASKQNLQASANKFNNIIGKSPRMRQVFDLIIQAAPSRSTILIHGESGTGKELVARAIHRTRRAPIARSSPSTRQPAAGPARVDAVRPRQGRVHRRGLPEERAVRPRRQGQHLLRRDRQHPARDAGQAAARDPGARVHAPRRHGDDQGRRPHHRRDQRRPAADDGGGKFREDLYYRLHVITIQLPPLRERKDDIPLLVQHFLEKYGEENNRKTGLELTPERSTC
jgi:DNA-binding NtrC family response regulator